MRRAGLLILLCLSFSCKSVEPHAAEVMSFIVSKQDSERLLREGERALRRSVPTDRWSQSPATLDEDWLMVQPEGYWSRAQHELPDFSDCANDSRCTPVFARPLCESDDACAPYRSRCEPLLASAPTSAPAVHACRGGVDARWDRVYTLAQSAQTSVDIIAREALPLPLRQSLIHALVRLSLREKPIRVRVVGTALGDSALWSSEILNAGGRETLVFEFLNRTVPTSALVIDETEALLVGTWSDESQKTVQSPVFDQSWQLRGPAVHALLKSWGLATAPEVTGRGVSVILGDQGMVNTLSGRVERELRVLSQDLPYDALMEALQKKGVKVEWLLSGTKDLPKAAQALRAKLESAKAEAPDGRSWPRYLCDNLRLAPWRFSAQLRSWTDGSSPVQTSELWLLDRGAVLGRFGDSRLAIFDGEKTREAQAEFWDRAWREAQPEQLSCQAY